MAQEQIKKSAGTRANETSMVTTEPVVDPAAAEAAEKIKAELDDLLDEIDSVLEVNAEEFVKGYIQKGGQ